MHANHMHRVILGRGIELTFVGSTPMMLTVRPNPVLKKACRLYAASWVRDIGPDLRPNDYKKDEGSEDKPVDTNATNDKKEPSTLEDLAVAARGGMETLRPALQRVYMTRASAYRDALKSFIQGYQEGIQQVMARKEDTQLKQKEDSPQKKEDNPQKSI
ncbi:uncharacterized protein LOC131234418 isoform X2 [Magnolia sinica]|uniref:uncharacterized protein LOC131234418 isoform X2 n=1 Tax=Magnolia sinica TaxID=86752 RepID=UPI00265B562F|nr:uncharacterized protein LOC131234418 isoform X2 [Magnolia sinica]